MLRSDLTVPLLATVEDYRPLEPIVEEVRDRLLAGKKVPNAKAHLIRELAKQDLYFLLRYVLSSGALKRPDGSIKLEHPWVLARCRDVQFDCHNVLDLWFREGWKSTIKTFGNVIRVNLNDPNQTFGIFSHTRPLAKKFLNRIKSEYETNLFLQRLFPEVIPVEPKSARYQGKWSEDDGICLIRSLNLAQQTVEAWGLIEGLPTGAHFTVLLFDDIIDEDTVTETQIEKATRAWEQAINLGMEGCEKWYSGTPYSHNDSYQEILLRGAARPRVHPCWEPDYEASVPHDKVPGAWAKLAFPPDEEAKSVYLNPAYILEKKRSQPWTFAAQMLMDPNAGLQRGFVREWLSYYDKSPEDCGRGKTIYILVDPANEKDKDASYTAMFVVGLGTDHNYYVLDAVRDRLDLHERASRLLRLHAKWIGIAGHVAQVRYERYGMQADIPYLEILMAEREHRFPITEVGGRVHKDDRIGRLAPLFRNHRILLPREMWRETVLGHRVNLVDDFVYEEFLKWPSSTSKDMLDCLARIAEPEMPLSWPLLKVKEKDLSQDRWDKAFAEADSGASESTSWMAA
jgi:phage terminase large subunit-like protein